MFCAILLCVGCSAEQLPLEDLKIVHVERGHEVGEPDQYTIAEWPDGTRSFRYRAWGEIGDTFKARRGANGGWTN